MQNILTSFVAIFLTVSLATNAGAGGFAMLASANNYSSARSNSVQMFPFQEKALSCPDEMTRYVLADGPHVVGEGRQVHVIGTIASPNPKPWMTTSRMEQMHVEGHRRLGAQWIEKGFGENRTRIEIHMDDGAILVLEKGKSWIMLQKGDGTLTPLFPSLNGLKDYESHREAFGSPIRIIGAVGLLPRRTKEAIEEEYLHFIFASSQVREKVREMLGDGFDLYGYYAMPVSAGAERLTHDHIHYHFGVLQLFQRRRVQRFIVPLNQALIQAYDNLLKTRPNTNTAGRSSYDAALATLQQGSIVPEIIISIVSHSENEVGRAYYESGQLHLELNENKLNDLVFQEQDWFLRALSYALTNPGQWHMWQGWDQPEFPVDDVNAWIDYVQMHREFFQSTPSSSDIHIFDSASYDAMQLERGAPMHVQIASDMGAVIALDPSADGLYHSLTIDPIRGFPESRVLLGTNGSVHMSPGVVQIVYSNSHGYISFDFEAGENRPVLKIERLSSGAFEITHLGNEESAVIMNAAVFRWRYVYPRQRSMVVNRGNENVSLSLGEALRERNLATLVSSYPRHRVIVIDPSNNHVVFEGPLEYTQRLLAATQDPVIQAYHQNNGQLLLILTPEAINIATVVNRIRIEEPPLTLAQWAANFTSFEKRVGRVLAYRNPRFMSESGSDLPLNRHEIEALENRLADALLIHPTERLENLLNDLRVVLEDIFGSEDFNPLIRTSQNDHQAQLTLAMNHLRTILIQRSRVSDLPHHSYSTFEGISHPMELLLPEGQLMVSLSPDSSRMEIFIFTYIEGQNGVDNTPTRGVAVTLDFDAQTWEIMYEDGSLGENGPLFLYEPLNIRLPVGRGSERMMTILSIHVSPYAVRIINPGIVPAVLVERIDRSQGPTLMIAALKHKIAKVLRHSHPEWSEALVYRETVKTVVPLEQVGLFCIGIVSGVLAMYQGNLNMAFGLVGLTAVVFDTKHESGSRVFATFWSGTCLLVYMFLGIMAGSHLTAMLSLFLMPFVLTLGQMSNDLHCQGQSLFTKSA